MPGVAERDLQHGLRAGRAEVVGPERADLLRDRAARRGREHVDRAAVRDRRRHPAEGHRELDVQPLRDLDEVGGDVPPPDRRLGTRDDHDVAAGAAGDEVDRRPVDPSGDTVDERDRRPGLLEVEQVREIHRRELPGRLQRLRDRGQRAGPREPAVDPTGERDEHHGLAQRRPLINIEHASHCRGGRSLAVARFARVAGVKFGVHTGLQNTSIGELQSLWRRIEDLGFDWISIWDHFYAADGTGNPHCLEAVASHAALGGDHVTRPLRQPRLLGRVPAPGGARERRGDPGPALRRPHHARARRRLARRGVQRRTASSSRRSGVRLRQVEEAIQCVRGLLTQDVTSFDGEYFTLTDAKCEPKPVQARLPLWIGGGGEKVTLRTAARHADGWNVPFISPEDYGRKVGILDRHCEDASRDPAEITRSVNVGIAFSDEALKAQFGNIAEFVRPGRADRQRQRDGGPGRAVPRRRRRVADPRDARAVRRRGPRPLRRRGAPAARRRERAAARSADPRVGRDRRRPPGPPEPRARPAPSRRPAARSASAGSKRRSRTRSGRSRTGGRPSRPATRSTPTARSAAGDRVRRAPARGASEVVLYSPDHAGSLATIGVDGARRVVDLWAERTEALLARPEIEYVLVFENRGALVGATIPHPHGQIYGFPFVPPVPRREAEVAAEHGCPVCAAVAGRGGRRDARRARRRAAGSPTSRSPRRTRTA